jgi:DeoR/GlpR family transcriptional regulator of sugar metabolism
MSNGNLYHPEGRVIRVKQAMMANATKKFMLLDHTKFGKAAVHLVAQARAFDMFVVDSLTDPMYLDQMRDLGVEYAIAPVETQNDRA